jgi:hypothetical protein
MFTVGRVLRSEEYVPVKGRSRGKRHREMIKAERKEIKKDKEKTKRREIRSTSKENDPFVYLDDCRCHIGFFSRASFHSFLSSISHYQHPSTQTHTHTHIYKITTSIFISSPFFFFLSFFC